MPTPRERHNYGARERRPNQLRHDEAECRDHKGEQQFLKDGHASSPAQ